MKKNIAKKNALKSYIVVCMVKIVLNLNLTCTLKWTGTLRISAASLWAAKANGLFDSVIAGMNDFQVKRQNNRNEWAQQQNYYRVQNSVLHVSLMS